MSNLIQTLKKGSDVILPRTKVEAISDANGNSLSSLMEAKVAQATISTTAPTTLADNTIYNLSDVTTLDLSVAFPATAFDCIINLSTAASGTVTITFPTSIYIPAVPTFGNGETWTLWIRNNPLTSGGIITAQKAVSS